MIREEDIIIRCYKYHVTICINLLNIKFENNSNMLFIADLPDI